MISCNRVVCLVLGLANLKSAYNMTTKYIYSMSIDWPYVPNRCIDTAVCAFSAVLDTIQSMHCPDVLYSIYRPTLFKWRLRRRILNRRVVIPWECIWMTMWRLDHAKIKKPANRTLPLLVSYVYILNVAHCIKNLIFKRIYPPPPSHSNSTISPLCNFFEKHFFSGQLVGIAQDFF